MTRAHVANKAKISALETRPIKGPVSVGTLALAFAAPALEKKGAVLSAILSDWAAIAGPALANHTLPQKVTKGSEIGGSQISAANLLIKVDPSRALDVQYKVPQLIERINQSLGYRAVGTIRLIQVPLPKAPNKRPLPGETFSNQQDVKPKNKLDQALARMKAHIASSETEKSLALSSSNKQ